MKGRKQGRAGRRGEDFGGGWSTRPPKAASARRSPRTTHVPGGDYRDGCSGAAVPPQVRSAAADAATAGQDHAAPGRAAVRRSLPQGLALLYEDEDVLVVDKPSGLLSVAAGGEKERTAYWVLCEYLRKRGEKRRAAAVHRLDRDTSGVMVFAKSEEIKRRLMEGWNESVLERRYIALAEGSFDAEEGLVDAPLGEDAGGRVVVVPGGLPARTRWRRLGEGCGYTLLELELETGRRNQIRAHLSYLGRPVAGDAKYGARRDPAGRLALHAESLAFAHPRDGRSLRFEVPAPPSFRKALSPSRGR